jgi:hypothetical protein
MKLRKSDFLVLMAIFISRQDERFVGALRHLLGIASVMDYRWRKCRKLIIV